jgi:AraC family transcriptional regulator
MEPAVATARLKRYAPGSRLAEHTHERARLCLVLRGGFEEGMQGRRHARAGGQLLFRPAGLRHDETFEGAGAVCGLIDARPDWLASAAESGLALDRPLVAEGPDVVRLGQVFQRERALGDAFSRLSLQGLLWEAIALLGRAERGAAGDGSLWVGRVEAHLHAHCGEPLGLGEVARALGVHPGHLARSFRTGCGETLGARLRRIRAERAAAMIRTTSAPLIEIAADCGFAHQAHMTRVFRALFGLTPGRYRRETR